MQVHAGYWVMTGLNCTKRLYKHILSASTTEQFRYKLKITAVLSVIYKPLEVFLYLPFS